MGSRDGVLVTRRAKLKRARRPWPCLSGDVRSNCWQTKHVVAGVWRIYGRGFDSRRLHQLHHRDSAPLHSQVFLHWKMNFHEDEYKKIHWWRLWSTRKLASRWRPGEVQRVYWWEIKFKLSECNFRNNYKWQFWYLGNDWWGEWQINWLFSNHVSATCQLSRNEKMPSWKRKNSFRLKRQRSRNWINEICN